MDTGASSLLSPFGGTPASSNSLQFSSSGLAPLVNPFSAPAPAPAQPSNLGGALAGVPLFSPSNNPSPINTAPLLDLVGGQQLPSNALNLYPGNTPANLAASAPPPPPAPTQAPANPAAPQAAPAAPSREVGLAPAAAPAAPAQPSPISQALQSNLSQDYSLGLGNFNSAVGKANTEYGNLIQSSQAAENQLSGLFGASKAAGENTLNTAQQTAQSRYGAQQATNAKAYSDSLENAMNFLGGRNLMGSSVADALAARLAKSNYESSIAATNNYAEALSNITNTRVNFDTAISNKLTQLHADTSAAVNSLQQQLQSALEKLNSQKNLLDADRAQAESLIKAGAQRALNTSLMNFNYQAAQLSDFRSASETAYNDILNQVQGIGSNPNLRYQNFAPSQPATGQTSLTPAGFAGLAPQGNVSGLGQNPFAAGNSPFNTSNPYNVR